MPAPATDWTAERVRELIDEERHWPRYEVIDGELLVTPAPSPVHQRAVALLFALLHPYVERTRIGHTFTSPADIELSPKTMVQPDVFVVPPFAGPTPRSWKEVERLLLAAEVISPSSAWSDRTKKRPLFQRYTVPEYWIVDVDSRIVERWRPGDDRPEVLRTAVTWQPSDEHEPLEIDLAAYFAEVTGE